MIDDDFIRTFERLAERSAPDIVTHLPELAEVPLHHHLIALGMSATVVTQGHMQALADGRYRLIVRSRTDHEVSLTVQNRSTGTSSGIGLRLIRNEVLYADPDRTALRPETAALLRAHAASDLYAEEGERITGFYATLRDALREEPYTSVLRMAAHTAVMFLDVEGEGQHTTPESIGNEAHKRLASLYQQTDVAPQYVSPQPALKA